MTTLKTRDQIDADLQEARRLAAEADEKQAAAKAADRDLYQREQAARTEGYRAYRDAANKAGGISREHNALAERFEAAVRNGDGAAVLSAWIAWRIVGADVLGQRVELDNAERIQQRRANPHATEMPHADQYASKPDFAGDLNRTLARIEAEHQVAGAEKVRAYVEQHVTRALG